MSRAFLRLICRGIRGVYAGYATSTFLSTEAHMYYKELYQTIEASPVPVSVYEQLLSDIDSAVKCAYEGAGFGEAERPSPEKDLLLNARLHIVLIPAVATLLRQSVPSLRPKVNRMAIYLADYSWLGFSDDRRTDLFRHCQVVDVLKKIPLRTYINGSDLAEQNGANGKRRIQQGQARRHCVRCCEVSGDVAPRRSIPWFRLVAKLGLLRSCLCGGMWTLESGLNPTPNEAHSQNSAREATADANG
jgi:mediator of RNA polymerase II transcription subunit 16, fungi type